MRTYRLSIPNPQSLTPNLYFVVRLRLRVDEVFAVVDEPALDARLALRPLVFLGSAVAVVLVDRVLAAAVPPRRLLAVVGAASVSLGWASEVAELVDESSSLALRGRRVRVEAAFALPVRLLPEETYRFRVRALMSIPFSENIAAKSS